MPDTPPRRKRRRTNNFSNIFAREQGMIALETRKIAVIGQCSMLLAEVVELLHAAGVNLPAPAPNPVFNGNMGQYAPPQPPAQVVVSRPCAWCGRQGTPVNVGNGQVQDLCPAHSAMIRGQQAQDAAAVAKGFTVDRTDARPAPPQQPQGKVLMHPTAADERAVTQHQQVAANGVATPEGFEEAEGE